ncbi:conserved Plasmodium protein, unknown function [Plasmodium berghei]|uniref:AP-5 complex subunit sigma-1, putative n=2 Tax=Plasmodium berghei TaxID=5821 RepID=A0A509ALJ3_PLABA|nr:AP-5 complex subunit sigma-1, putative [Plasmodium berghei ANKA]CXI73737.1 conserved Plasmodium protein, unknown function [Plasmodium berghei]SCM24591.1 conserved Plasmodium protein, unknown function [Plasmodium berghei]SCN27109.1 conserved Plasmodium protein, unknown function [Plasmodium berghei]SCO61616.1 conserved Plasmodium protein, unknown function [Plasmodium berghei]SCO63532.1 conserved Plasmodium protein, unknown function [Plasmodium berghei]|eukprot:XP_034422743.1 AP-5 complex subunit sigma-1, putative [Plasmodium berghei ANKA]
MVYGIIIHSSESEQIYFSTYYNLVNNDINQSSRQQIIIKKVIEEINYYKEDKENNENTNKNNKDKYLDIFGVFIPSRTSYNEFKIDNEGFFKIENISLFKNKINIMWKVLNKVCYTLMFSPHENIHMADNFLNTLIYVLMENYEKFEKSNKNDMNKFNPDTVLAILYFFLPKGQFMILTPDYVQILSNKVKEFLGEKQSQNKNDDFF